MNTQFTINHAPWFAERDRRIIEHAAAHFVRALGIDAFPSHRFEIAFGPHEEGEDINGAVDVDGRRVQLAERTLAVTLCVLGHELIHVHQVARGDLRTTLNPAARYWKGKLQSPVLQIIAEQFGDAALPWEMEAYSRQMVLYREMLDTFPAADRAHIRSTETGRVWALQLQFAAQSRELQETGEVDALVSELMATPFAVMMQSGYEAYMRRHASGTFLADAWTSLLSFSLMGAGAATWLALIVNRLAMGVFFSASGFNKLFHPERHATLKKTLEENGIPAPHILCWLVAGVEFFGGLALVIGLLTPLAALGLLIICVVATLTDGLRRSASFGSINSADEVANWLYLPEVLYSVALLLIVVTGAGALSVDAYLAERLP